MDNLRKKELISILCFSLSLFLFLSGCSKPQQTQVSQSKTDKDVYKIAVAAPQFGPYQALGLSIINGAQLAVDLKNELGGIDGRKIHLVKIDDGGLAGEGTWRAKSLVDEMVLGVIGHLNSDISIPASEIYSKAKIAEITPGSTSPLFTERHTVKGYVFRTIGRDDQQGQLAAQFTLQKGFKKVGILYNNRGYGLSLASEFVKQINASSKDTKIVFYETYKVGNDDYSNKVLRLKEQSPDLLFFVGEYGDAAKFLKQLRNSGLSIAFLGSEGVFAQEFIGNAKSSCEGALVISLPVVADKNFLASYKKNFGKELGSYSANSFDATNILILAIEKVRESNSDKVAKAIREVKDYQGLTGKISFDPKGDLVNPKFSIYQVKNGMFVVVQ